MTVHSWDRHEQTAYLVIMFHMLVSDYHLGYVNTSEIQVDTDIHTETLSSALEYIHRNAEHIRTKYELYTDKPNLYTDKPNLYTDKPDIYTVSLQIYTYK